MDARKFLPLLLLATCTISAASSIRNGWGGSSSNVRHIRRISLNEFLIPPPPPRFNSIRTGRVANHRPTEAQGYFAQLMSWLNPFSYGSSSASSSSSPPSLSEAPYSPSSKFIQPLSSRPAIYNEPPPSPPAPIYNEPPPSPPAPIYNEPPVPPPPVYEKPPLPSSTFNNPTYLIPIKAKNCNPCNKVPWMPIRQDDLPHLRDASFTSPIQLSPAINGDYQPNHEASHQDVHQAASQEVRAPDFSFVSPSVAANEQRDDSLISPLSNPHLYPGAMPPLFKAEDFNYSVENSENFNENSGYRNAPSSVPQDVAGNGSFLHISHPEPSSQSNFGVIHQQLKYTSPGASPGDLNNFRVQNHGDLSSSSSQVSHVNPVSDQHGPFEVTAIRQDSFGTVNHQTTSGDSAVLDHQSSGILNSEGFYDVTGSSGPLNDLAGNASQIDENLPSSYGISSLDQAPSNFGHNNFFPSSNVAENSHAPLRTSDGSSVKIEDSVHFEESPLLDFTYKGESRTDSSSIPPTSNAIADFESVEAAGTTLAPRDELFGIRRVVASTESYSSTNNIQIINSLTSLEASRINDSVSQNGDLRDPKISRGKDISYIPPADQVGYLWPSIMSTTLKGAERESFRNAPIKPYDNIAKETSKSVIANVEDAGEKTSARQQAVKRNKQVQVIIPYTSQYTPLPFHPLHQNHDRRVTYTEESNPDNYISEESRIKVTSLLNVSYNSQTTSAILDDVTEKSVGAKVNNSIDVHRLQKNIDNWTIQEYSRGTTASTISPSSSNPYLFPSKQIPDEYLTTTESINHAANPPDSNVKTFTLAGFSFNDVEYKSSGSNREESRVQIIETEGSKSTESSSEASTVSNKEDTNWQGFSVDISPSNKERVYVVTPQPSIVVTKSSQVEKTREKTTKEIDQNSKELRKTSDTKKTKKKVVSDTYESIEKAYQVLPQAVNNLAVASTGPENVPLWGIMEHEEFALLDDTEQDNEKNAPSDIPILYAGHSKVSHARR